MQNKSKIPGFTAQDVEFPSPKGSTLGYLALPQDEKPHPGIVAIQEWWGLVPHIKDIAGRFAQEGFICLAPDLYHGQAATEPNEARKLSMQLEVPNAMIDINSTANYLLSLKNVQPNKVGIVGWCLGGRLAIAATANNSKIGAAVIFYGRPQQELEEKIQAPLLGLYAEHDHSIKPDELLQFDQVLASHGIPHEIITYPNTEHAFFNDTRPGIYNSEAASDAWQRTLRWFRKYLK